MDFLRNIVMSGLAAALLQGCYTDFDPKVGDSDVLCMNSMIIAGEPIDVALSHTWLYSAPPASVAVDDAEVSLWVNGVEADMASCIPTPGDLVRLEAVCCRYGRAEAEVTVPAAPSIELSSLEVDAYATPPFQGVQDDEVLTSMGVHLSVNADITLHDLPGTSYYKLSTECLVPEGVDVWGGMLDYDAEPIFSEHISALESIFGSDAYGFTVFSDRRFSGGSYRLTVRLSDISIVWYGDFDYETMNGCKLVLTIGSMSKSLYDWFLYDWTASDGMLGMLADVGFAETMVGCSNVSTGAGIVSAQALSTIEIDLKPYIIQSINEIQEK